MQFPVGLKYTDSHEWIRIEGDDAVVGLSDFAQDSLGDVVHIELPEVGRAVSRGESVAEVESVKAVSDVYAPVTGEVVAINEELDGNEDRVNKDPYGGGWLFRIRIAEPAEMADRMDAEAYEAHVAASGH